MFSSSSLRILGFLFSDSKSLLTEASFSVCFQSTTFKMQLLWLSQLYYEKPIKDTRKRAWTQSFHLLQNSLFYWQHFPSFPNSFKNGKRKPTTTTIAPRAQTAAFWNSESTLLVIVTSRFLNAFPCPFQQHPSASW